MTTLTLTIKKAPFDVMVTGEKNFEIREKSRWMTMRLYDRNGQERKYDFVKFTNGYGKDKPYFIAEFEGFDTIFQIYTTFSNGFRLDLAGEYWRINLGEVVEAGNLRRYRNEHL